MKFRVKGLEIRVEYRSGFKIVFRVGLRDKGSIGSVVSGPEFWAELRPMFCAVLAFAFFFSTYRFSCCYSELEGLGCRAHPPTTQGPPPRATKPCSYTY